MEYNINPPKHSQTNKANAKSSNKETRGTISKKKDHMDHQIKFVSSIIKSTYTLKSQFQKKNVISATSKIEVDTAASSPLNPSSVVTSNNSKLEVYMVTKHYFNYWVLFDIRYRWKKINEKISCESLSFSWSISQWYASLSTTFITKMPWFSYFTCCHKKLCKWILSCCARQNSQPQNVYPELFITVQSNNFQRYQQT